MSYLVLRAYFEPGAGLNCGSPSQQLHEAGPGSECFFAGCTRSLSLLLLCL